MKRMGEGKEEDEKAEEVSMNRNSCRTQMIRCELSLGHIQSGVCFPHVAMRLQSQNLCLQ